MSRRRVRVPEPGSDIALCCDNDTNLSPELYSATSTQLGGCTQCSKLRESLQNQSSEPPMQSYREAWNPIPFFSQRE